MRPNRNGMGLIGLLAQVLARNAMRPNRNRIAFED